MKTLDINNLIERVAYGEVLTEGVMEREATILTRETMKRLRATKIDGPDPIKNLELLYFKESELRKLGIDVITGFEVELTSVPLSGNKPFAIGGVTHADEFNFNTPNYTSDITIYIDFNSKYFTPLKSMLQDLNIELKVTIRHELEHALQVIKDIDIFWAASESSRGIMHDTRPLYVSRYYLSSGEVAAYSTQIYKRAKMQKISVSKAMDQVLYQINDVVMARTKKYGEDPLFYKDKSNLKDLKKVYKNIKKTYTAYIKKRFPNAKF